MKLTQHSLPHRGAPEGLLLSAWLRPLPLPFSLHPLPLPFLFLAHAFIFQPQRGSYLTAPLILWLCIRVYLYVCVCVCVSQPKWVMVVEGRRLMPLLLFSRSCCCCCCAKVKGRPAQCGS